MTAPAPPDAAAALFLDVDGTLLEIAPRPELVKVPPEMPALLDRLSGRLAGALALISGRPIAQLDRLFTPWRGAAAGLHGSERRAADGTVHNARDSDAAAALAALRPALARLAASLPGVLLEDKGLSLALHYRNAPEHQGAVRAAAARLCRAAPPGLRLIEGKMVVELAPAGPDKGTAIEAFMAEPPFLGRVPYFLGDDVTDEDGFRAVNRLGGVSIRVGPPRATAAAFALGSVAEARAWLAAAAGGEPAPAGTAAPARR